MTKPEELEWLGAFEPPQAEQVLEALSKVGIPFEIARDDSAIRNLAPISASLGGTFGHGALIVVHVPTHRAEDARQAMATFLPPESKR